MIHFGYSHDVIKAYFTLKKEVAIDEKRLIYSIYEKPLAGHICPAKGYFCAMIT